MALILPQWKISPILFFMIVLQEAKILPLWSLSTLCLYVCPSACLSVLSVYFFVSMSVLLLDNILMDTEREKSKVKNRHWLKLDHVTCLKLDLIDSDYINIFCDWLNSFIFVFQQTHCTFQQSKENIKMCKAA